MRLKLIQSGPTINTESQNLQRVLSLAEKILFLANFIVMCRAYSNVLDILEFRLSPPTAKGSNLILD